MSRGFGEPLAGYDRDGRAVTNFTGTRPAPTRSDPLLLQPLQDPKSPLLDPLPSPIRSSGSHNYIVTPGPSPFTSDINVVFTAEEREAIAVTEQRKEILRKIQIGPGQQAV